MSGVTPTESRAKERDAARPSGADEVRSLAVFHLAGVGGPQRSLTGTMRWLRERGPVDILVPENGPAEAVYREFGRVTVGDYSALTYARGLRQGVATIRRLGREVAFFRRELRRTRPDVVVVVTTVLPALLVAARLERVPAVVYAAEIYQQRWKGAPLLRLWGTLLARATAYLSDGIVACSEAVGRQFPRRSGKPLTIAYPPIDPAYREGDRARGRARYGLDDAGPALAVIGDLSRGRGQDLVVRALPAIRKRLPAARALIVGGTHRRAADLAYARELRELVQELGLADAVVFAEPTHDMADVYAACDIVVNPARFEEPFGRVAPEALMAGRPVVASRVGAIPEVIRDGVDGLLVPPDDPEALAAAVLRLAADPALAAALVASGRQVVLERFGWEQDLAAWTDALVPAIERGRS